MLTAPAIDEQRYLQASAIACTCLIVAFVGLTVGDVLSTLAGLAGGGVAELNPLIAHPDGGIRLGFLVVANTVLLVPLLIAFTIGVVRSERVPADSLRHWRRHVFDVFYIHPRDERARARAPLRLVSAAMTVFALKLLILVSNLLALYGLGNPVSALAAFWTGVGLTGAPRYWASYLVMIVPCYALGVGLAATVMQAVLRAGAGSNATG